jgi:hypothetical protein
MERKRLFVLRSRHRRARAAGGAVRRRYGACERARPAKTKSKPQKAQAQAGAQAAQIFYIGTAPHTAAHHHKYDIL